MGVITTRYPRPLISGAAIGVTAPAGPVQESFLDRGCDWLRCRGYRPVPAPGILRRRHHLAGTHEERLTDLHRMFADPAVEAVFAARGGYGCLPLLPRLDFELIARSRRLLVGYSDITAMQLAIWQRTGLATCSGPMVAIDMARPGVIAEELFWALVGGDSGPRVAELIQPWLQAPEVVVLRPGTAAGPLLGGTLSVIAALAGTTFMPDFTDAVLILEEPDERLFRIDRWLTQLRLAGIFARVGMVLLGHFSSPDAEENRMFGEFFREFFAADRFPILAGIRYGHCPLSLTFMQGMVCAVDADRGAISLPGYRQP
ncbi:MAG: LD-carboxypeptidase [Deltaproteobacteria bacterium]|nr:LD-carboxypeptidase [Candidatus Anaeroferrophillacea bacterium]